LRSSLDQIRVPDAVRREVGRYASRSFTCLPAAPPPPPPPPPAPPPPVVSTSDDGDDDPGKGKHKGHEKKHKKHGHDDRGDE